jgi:hypothetical protein
MYANERNVRNQEVVNIENRLLGHCKWQQANAPVSERF